MHGLLICSGRLLLNAASEHERPAALECEQKHCMPAQTYNKTAGVYGSCLRGNRGARSSISATSVLARAHSQLAAALAASLSPAHECRWCYR